MVDQLNGHPTMCPLHDKNHTIEGHIARTVATCQKKLFMRTAAVSSMTGCGDFANQVRFSNQPIKISILT